MDILQATIRVVRHHQQWRTENVRGSAVIMHPTQYRELCDIRIDGAPGKFRPNEIEGLPIWLHRGMCGPAVVDRRTLIMLMMIGAVKVD